MASFHIITFGCQMNVRDSRWLKASLENAGHRETSLGEARIIIINSCSVREKPEKKIGNLIRQIGGASHNSPDIAICVAGCAAQQLGEKLLEFSPQVRLVAGPDALADIPKALESILADPGLKAVDTLFKPIYPERAKIQEAWPDGQAYVNIMEGCDNFCAYCIVPYTRGRQKSRPEREILEECERALAGGAGEITLLGQNVNAWGKDVGEKGSGSFPDLLYKVSALSGLRRLRFVTPHPADLDARTIKAFGELKNLCPRLHLPLQAGSDRILARMRRRYDSAAYLRLVYSLRESRPDIALSTDLIAGFPEETEEDFRQTLEMMKRCRFVSAFSFCYSDRPGTMASYMKNKIPDEIKQERLLRMQELQSSLEAGWLAGRVGQETEILVEAPSAKSADDKPQWRGKDPYGAVINIESRDARPGEYKKVAIYEAGKHSLKGRALD